MNHLPQNPRSAVRSPGFSRPGAAPARCPRFSVQGRGNTLKGGHRALAADTLKGGHRAAFTLIELLVVISIIAILAGLTFSTYKGVSNKMKRSTTAAQRRQIELAINEYYAK